MGDLEQAGWEKELASHVTAIQCPEDLLPFLKEKFDPGPVCLHINASAMVVLHSYTAGSPRPAPKKPSLGRVSGGRVAASDTAPPFIPAWLERNHRSELSIVLRAYARLTRFANDSCVIFTGETGSGKTVCCKTCLGHLVSFTPYCRAGDSRRLGNLLVLIGPLLDAFGNAATSRNDNSSRFGKCVSTIFDFRGYMVGAKVLHFMLERNRVTHRKVGERNFHIFYQLVKGGQSSLLKALHLKSDETAYQYISRRAGGPPPTAGTTDKADFAFVLSALKMIGLGEDQLAHLWKVVSAILQLGQLKFEKDGINGSTVLNRPQLKVVSSLVGLDEGDIEQFLCFKHTRSALISVSIEEAVRQRDMIAQALYDQVFLWLIQAINAALRPMPDETDRVVTSPGYQETFRNINFVDFYGFAQQEASSFEQMCMNYSCEKLHQVFLNDCIKMRLQTFQQENVFWKDISFTDNTCVCDLFDNTNQGVFTLLDRATCDAQGENGDKTFLDLMDTTVGGHETYTSRQVDPGEGILCPFLDFKVRHFAGGVTYTIDGFVSSNTNVVTDAVSDLFLRSTNDVIKDIGVHQTRGEMTPNSTVGVNFRNAVTTLTDSIEHQDAYHVRCLKPNDTKSPRHFDEVKVRQQCADMCLSEAIMVEQIGHVVQVSYSEFFGRYRVVCGRLKSFSGSMQDACKVILQEIVPNYWDSVSFGESMIFLKRAEPMVLLNECRENKLVETAVLLCRHWQKHRLRKCLRTISESFRSDPKNVEWPASNLTIGPLLALCQRIHRKWLYDRLLFKIPDAHQPDIRLKVTGLNILGGKRRKWGHSRRWHGDYLSVNPAFRTRVASLKKEAKFDKIIFSCPVSKVNKRLKVQDRALVVTDNSLMLLEASDGYAITKAPLPLNQLKALEVSSGHDQAISLRTAGGDPDRLLALKMPDASDDFIGELVAVICQAASKQFGMCPTVRVSQQIKATLEIGEVVVDLDYQFNTQAEFKKAGAHKLTLLWPA